MPLIKNIETLRQFTRVNFVNQTSLMPDISGCENRYIIPIIGSTIYGNLQTLANNNDVTNPLLILARKAIAPLTFYKDLPVIHLQVGDKGLYTDVSDNTKSATRWEFNALRDYFAEEGCAALEVLLQYLFENKTALSWVVPDAYKLLFLTGNEFAKYYPLFQPYRTFEFLRTISRQAEDEFLKPNIGEDFFNYLRDYEAATDADAIIVAKIKKAVQLLKKAAAFQTIKLATELLPVKFNGTGFTVQLAGYNSDAVNASENAATESNIQALRNSCTYSSESYMQQLLQYLQINASADLFSIFFNSELYKIPNTEKPKSINESTKNFYM